MAASKAEVKEAIAQHILALVAGYVDDDLTFEMKGIVGRENALTARQERWARDAGDEVLSAIARVVKRYDKGAGEETRAALEEE